MEGYWGQIGFFMELNHSISKVNKSYFKVTLSTVRLDKLT